MMYFLISGLICFFISFINIEVKKDRELLDRIDELFGCEECNALLVIYLTALLFGWLCLPLYIANKALNLFKK